MSPNWLKSVRWVTPARSAISALDGLCGPHGSGRAARRRSRAWFAGCAATGRRSGLGGDRSQPAPARSSRVVAGSRPASSGCTHGPFCPSIDGQTLQKPAEHGVIGVGRWSPMVVDPPSVPEFRVIVVCPLLEPVYIVLALVTLRHKLVTVSSK